MSVCVWIHERACLVTFACTFSYMVQCVCVCMCAIFLCLCSCSSVSINILCCSLQSSFCLFLFTPILQSSGDSNPKLLGSVISIFPFFKNHCHCALEQCTQPSSLGDCDCTVKLLGDVFDPYLLCQPITTVKNCRKETKSDSQIYNIITVFSVLFLWCLFNQWLTQLWYSDYKKY